MLSVVKSFVGRHRSHQKDKTLLSNMKLRAGLYFIPLPELLVNCVCMRAEKITTSLI